jgi:HK97 family phage prohead protease/HK97 family phage major capsid protein
MELLRFNPHPVTIDAAAGDETPKRTIMGLAAPYGEEAVTMDGTRVKFAPGSLPTDGRAPKLLQYHDTSRPIGLVTERVEVLTGDAPGMYFAARISDVPEGSAALTLAIDGVLDGVSVGVVPTEWTYDDNGTMIVTASTWNELSMVPMPAFESSRIHQIAAQAGNNEEQTEPDAVDPEENESEENPEMAQNVETPQPLEASTPVTPLWAAARGHAPKLPSPAEYMVAFAAGSTAFAEMNARISAAAPNITTVETPGILPEVITGSVFDSLNPIRPFVSAIGTKAMPTAGATFRRPKIGTRPVVTEQPTGQLNTLSASEVTVTNSDVSKLSFGTYVTVSEQDLDFTDPASINIILEQLAIAYGQATDNYAVDQLTAGTTQSETVVDLASPADWIEAIYGAAYQISVNSNYLPTHWVMNPVTWAKLGQLVDTTGRPVFPSVSPMNAFGSQQATTWNGNPLGLNLVVDKNMAGGTGAGSLQGIIGHAAGAAAGFEFYEQMKGALSIDVPQIMGRTISFRGYAASFMADATKFVKLVKS